MTTTSIVELLLLLLIAASLIALITTRLPGAILSSVSRRRANAQAAEWISPWVQRACRPSGPYSITAGASGARVVRAVIIEAKEDVALISRKIEGKA